LTYTLALRRRSAQASSFNPKNSCRLTLIIGEFGHAGGRKYLTRSTLSNTDAAPSRMTSILPRPQASQRRSEVSTGYRSRTVAGTCRGAVPRHVSCADRRGKGCRMKRFIILDPFGGLLDETDDLNVAQTSSRMGHVVTCYVEPESLAALSGFIREASGAVDMRLRRRRWKTDRIAEDPTCAFCGRS
jgi:hypothetical protein